MRVLYLNRHAKSSWSQPYNTDAERPLNKRGKVNALFMGKRFAQETRVDLILSSPAKRALQTANYFAEALGIADSDIAIESGIYGASVGEMMTIINALDQGHEHVIIFGHNPTFSDLAAHIDHNHDLDMVTCARVKLEFEVESWDEIGANSGTLMYHDYPRKYPEMADL
jgi:phosphohistidine phosphatase